MEKVAGEYHLYYLWKPMADQSEGNLWYEVKTRDFIHYENVGIALESNLLYDNYGCEGGCRISVPYIKEQVQRISERTKIAEERQEA